MESRIPSERKSDIRQKQDRDLEAFMGNLLRYGVLASALIVLVGGILYLFQYGQAEPHYGEFGGEPGRLKNLVLIVRTALSGQGRSIIQLGLLILMATPIFRILAAVTGYLFERDWKYVLITLTALAIILTALLHDSL